MDKHSFCNISLMSLFADLLCRAFPLESAYTMEEKLCFGKDYQNKFDTQAFLDAYCSEGCFAMKAGSVIPVYHKIFSSFGKYFSQYLRSAISSYLDTTSSEGIKCRYCLYRSTIFVWTTLPK